MAAEAVGGKGDRAGFVLAGGQSSRMGRDKALLPLDGSTLIERTAELVRAAAGSVTLIGDPQRYAHLGLAVVADLVENCGPLGGLYTILKSSESNWNLVVACDMPGLTVDLLRDLLTEAQLRDTTCLVVETESGLHPLCAVYHRRALPAIAAQIEHKRFKMHELLELLGAVSWPVADEALLRNINTPDQWAHVPEAR